MVSEQSSMRNARGALWLLAGVAALALVAGSLVLARSAPGTRQAPAPYAQLENKEGLFPPPPSGPRDEETYVYTPASAEGDQSSSAADDASSPRERNTSPPEDSVEESPSVYCAFVPSACPQEPPDPTFGSVVGAVVWVERPTARRISELYPQRALRQGLGGRVALDCTVLASLAVECAVASESPPGEGFGRAALAAAQSYRSRPTLSDGRSAVGTRTRVIMSFQAPQ